MGVKPHQVGRKRARGVRLLSRVAVVTDSTADIPRQIAESLGITVVPLRVHFGEESYLDYEEMSPEGFFQKLASSPHHPRTSQPSPGEFAGVYQHLSSEGYDILSIHISSELSGTYQSATMARDMVPSAEIRVIDSRSVSVGLTLAVKEAARAATDGCDLATCAARAGGVLEGLQIYFAVDTLEYLHRNGRIGRAQHLMGTLLNMKPILTISEGLVGPFDRVRGKSKVIPRLLEIVKEKVPPGGEVLLAVVHGNALQQAGEIVNGLRAIYGQEEILLGSVGPVIGTHSGPGVLGIGICPL